MRFVLLSFFAFLVASQAHAYEDVIKKAENYLNNLTTIQADFVQDAGWADSSLEGTFYLKRPGKLRFNYAPPIKDFIVADGRFIFYYDAELEQQSNAPIGSTLADFILRDKIRLSGDVTITKIEESRADYFITLTQTEDPGAGALTLIFNKRPFRLSRWIVTDAQGLITRVALSSIKTGMKLDNDLFYYIDPKHGQGRLNE